MFFNTRLNYYTMLIHVFIFYLLAIFQIKKCYYQSFLSQILKD